MAGLLISCIFILSGTVSAHTWNVNNGTSNSIQNTIYQASNGDTLNLSAGKYKQQSEIHVTKSVTITGPAYSGTPTAVIDAQRYGRVFEIDQGTTVTLKNLLIINGYNTMYDGTGVLNHGTVNIVNCVIENNSGVNGGGIFNNHGKITIINSKIIHNHANNGGGIFNEGTLNISNSHIDNNLANNSGGGIYNTGTCNVTTNSFIQNNTAKGNGGGIYNNDLCLISDHNSIQKNTANGNGGGIDNEKTCTIDGSKLLSNTAKGNGGGIYNKISCTLTDYSSIIDNIANIGGGIYNEGNCTFNYSNITSNYAINGTGGGIYNNKYTCTFTSCNITHNNALYNGGGLYNSGGVCKLSKSAINNNIAVDGNGGGVDNDYTIDSTKPDYGVLTFTNCAINNNIAEDGNGGGIYNPGGDCTLNKCNATNNTAFFNGGGIYNQAVNTGNYKSSICIINSSYISSNTATSDGGGIYYTGSGKYIVFNSTLIYNVAFSVGGGISNTGTNCEITSSIIKNNYAAHAGGGIYNLGICTVHFSELYNNNAYLGSAIYSKGQYLDASMNWWGKNIPDFAGLIYGNAPNTWFIMKLNATPTTINKNSTSKITANLLYDNKNIYHSPTNGHLPNRISITFTTNSSYGSINSPVSLSNGQAIATFKSKTTSITTTVYAKLDDKTINTTIKIQ